LSIPPIKSAKADSVASQQELKGFFWWELEH
jgi:hypothetical protein